MTVRVRFAPSPTGRMHIGNVRAALMNYLFARQKKGTFVLRVEDTDAQRNQLDGVIGILNDLRWCGMNPDEGPGSPSDEQYFQSKRQNIYLQSLAQLVDAGRVYKCFCTPERLEKMREMQRAEGKPPRYDGRCRDLDEAIEKKQTTEGTPFVWRFAVNSNEEIMVPTLGEPLAFDMQHFADFAITRADESFTFIFTNAVDDIDMEITHVIRGSDHLSNTASQAVLYAALGHAMPVFIHLPLLSGKDGKKLSKRDFGFSLHDIQRDGIVPEALMHYLLTVGGTTIDHPMTREELWSQALEGRLSSSGHITYDIDALRAVSRQYVHWLPQTELHHHLLSYEAALGSEPVPGDAALVGALQKEVNNLAELRDLMGRICAVPKRDRADLLAHCGDAETMERVIARARTLFEAYDSSEALAALKAWAKAEKIGMKVVLGTLRYAVTGMLMGIGMNVLIDVVPGEEIAARLKSL